LPSPWKGEGMNGIGGCSKEVEYIVVIYNEETQTYKFRCYVSDSSKEDLWRLGFFLIPLIALGILGWKIKDTTEPNLFHLFGFQLAVVVIVFIALVYIALHSLKTVVLTYDEIILIKDYIGFLKERILYSQIKELEVLPYSEANSRGLVKITTENKKTHKFDVENPEKFKTIIRERTKRFRFLV
jgi:hypothetical protein